MEEPKGTVEEEEYEEVVQEIRELNLNECLRLVDSDKIFDVVDKTLSSNRQVHPYTPYLARVVVAFVEIDDSRSNEKISVAKIE